MSEGGGSAKPTFGALPEGYELLLRGTLRDVVMRTDLRRELTLVVGAQEASALEALLEHYGESGPDALASCRFRALNGWHAGSDEPIQLEVFTPHELHAYGFCRALNGKPTFFVTGISASMKQQSQEVVRAAGYEALRIHALLN